MKFATYMYRETFTECIFSYFSRPESSRKTTPPDLLALSNMYFDRNQTLIGPRIMGPRHTESSHENRWEQ